MQESGEMYLETILVLSEQLERVRSIDISEYMSFSKPSVSRAIGLLKNGGFISVDPSGYIELTESGRKIAMSIYRRHTIIAQVLEKIGVSKETASNDACKIEHDISDETFSAICKIIENHPKQN